MAKLKKPGPLSKFLRGLDRQLNKLALRQFYRVKQPFTFDDLRQMFVPELWRKRLTEVFQVASPDGTSYDLYAGLDKLFVVNFTWHTGDVGGYMPMQEGTSSKAPLLACQKDCPESLYLRFQDTLREMRDISYQFGEAMWVANELDKYKHFKTLAAVRFFWPCIVPLLQMSGETQLIDQLQKPDPRAIRNSTIPPSLREDDTMRRTNDLISRALLIEPASAPSLPVPYKLYPVPNFGKFTGATDW